MGVWGDGNFDNDDAADYLEVLKQKLVATVQEILADDERVALDEDGEGMLMPSVELLCVLCERYNAAPPPEELVRQWHKKYLRVFDRQIGALSPDRDYKDSRRKTIEKTFLWLEGLAQSFYEKD
jgi:hypothetical protein